MTEQLNVIDMQVVNGEAIQAFAVGSTKEVSALLGLLDFTHKAVQEAAASQEIDFAKALSDTAIRSLAEVEALREETDPVEHALLVARIKRGFTLLSFLTGQAIPAHMVLIDHVTARAAEATLVMQKQLKEEEVARSQAQAVEETALH